MSYIYFIAVVVGFLVGLTLIVVGLWLIVVHGFVLEGPIEISWKNVSIKGVGGSTVLIIVGVFLLVLTLGDIRKLAALTPKIGLKDAIVEVSRQQLSGIVEVRPSPGSKRETGYFSFPIAFSSTPFVAVQPLSLSARASAQSVTTTGFEVVVESDSGFTDGPILIKWMATE